MAKRVQFCTKLHILKNEKPLQITQNIEIYIKKLLLKYSMIPLVWDNCIGNRKLSYNY